MPSLGLGIAGYPSTLPTGSARPGRASGTRRVGLFMSDNTGDNSKDSWVKKEVVFGEF